jgi:hypothetical protein
LTKGTVGCEVIGDPFLKYPDQTLPTLQHAVHMGQGRLKVLSRSVWTEIDQAATRHQRVVNLFEGIDHALMRHSSEGPGQNGHVEAGAGDAQCRARANPKRHFALQPRRGQFVCPVNQRRSRIDPHDISDDGRDAPR